jgi:hypothetical protein
MEPMVLMVEIVLAKSKEILNKQMICKMSNTVNNALIIAKLETVAIHQIMKNNIILLMQTQMKLN